MGGHKHFLRAKTHFFRDLNLDTVLVGEAHGDSTFTATKVVATVGPACQDVDVMAELLDAGMVGARVDLTWGPLDFHRKSLENLQLAMKKARRLCATMVDTLGREVMVRRQVKLGDDGWPIHEETFHVAAGQKVTLTTRTDVEASNEVLPVTYEKFAEMVEKGDMIYVGRYLVSGADAASLYLEVVDIQGQDIFCISQNEAVLDGLLTVFHTERSSDSLLNVQNDLPLFSDYDKECLQILSQEYEIDFLSLSYTKEALDVQEARRYLDSIGMTTTKLLAKIETRQSLINFQDILNEADGIIISRGNLGLDCVPEKMALVQKTLIQACNLVGKPVIITRVVDTMVNTPRPTRAEATDVANAVLDGVDGILLGAETLRGKYPLQTITTVTSIARSGEKVFDHHYHYDHLMEIALDASGVPIGSDDESESANNQGHSNSMASMSLANLHSVGANVNEADMAVAVKAAGTRPMLREGSGVLTSYNMAARAMAKFSMGSSTSLNSLSKANGAHGSGSMSSLTGFSRQPVPYLSKMESIASSAVRAADKVGASLIVVYTHTGKTAQLVAKYRPPMPILTLVVPQLVSDSLRWKLLGRSNARQCLLTRGLMPMLAAPSPSGDALLEEAVAVSARMGLVKPHDHVVCVQRIHDDFCVKIVAVDEMGGGIKRPTPLNEVESSPFGAHFTYALDSPMKSAVPAGST